MEKRHSLSAILLIFIGLFSLAASAIAAKPHFYLQMGNDSNKDAVVSFRPLVGNISLQPALADQTPLKAQSRSERYAVIIEPVDPNGTFDIVFKGKQECAFNLAFYAPGNPKVTVSGMGCYGGGYKLIDNDTTLLLYVTDIHRKPK